MQIVMGYAGDLPDMEGRKRQQRAKGDVYSHLAPKIDRKPCAAVESVVLLVERNVHMLYGRRKQKGVSGFERYFEQGAFVGQHRDGSGESGAQAGPRGHGDVVRQAVVQQPRIL